MVAAKLDQSRVLVTKFRQNRLTLKGRSAGQRQTNTHTDRQTRLKIRALEVCNQANTPFNARFPDEPALLVQAYDNNEELIKHVFIEHLKRAELLGAREEVNCLSVYSTLSSATHLNDAQV